ncbi:hypothetical protein ACNVED_01195 [Legionella sp. D16C41]|uniref:hypothetical protein n=1 Tax=Legionella sp. D16C41 TaxID=3402688 RepID=UPI003AF5C641
MNIDLVDKTTAWAVHFCATFYSLSQVVAGKTLLSDLPAQYGLYSEILAPIFKIIGLSIFKYTFVLGILHFAALLSLLVVYWKVQKNKYIFLFYSLTLCLTTGFTWHFIKSAVWEPYFQYDPIRFFFPAISLLLQYRLIQKPSEKLSLIIGVFSAVSMLWNLETGIAIFGAFLSYIGSYILFPSVLINKKRAVYLIMHLIASWTLTLLIFISYLYIKSDHGIDLSQLFKYQKIFYKTGFMMLPLPLSPDPWQIIYGIYLFGIVGALYNWKRQSRSKLWEIIFFLSILGLGLFIYYQGRAHVKVLILVSWPAIFIAFSLLDFLFRLIYLQLIPRVYLLLSIPILSFSFLTAAEFFKGIPLLYQSAKKNFSYYYSKNNYDTETKRNLEFIKKNSPSKNILILTSNQAIYYGELGFTSPINGPGSAEIILKEDLEKLKKNILQQESFFFQPEINNLIPLNDILENFYVVTKNDDNIILYARKNT